MNKLFNILNKYNLEDALNFESNDRQFIALKKLEKKITNKDLYLLLVILNSLICYQLSGKGEDYWEEFSEYFCNFEINKNNIINDIGIFMTNSKNNRRFIDTKKKRLSKLNKFILNFEGKSEYYYKNMIELRDILSKTMNQKKDAKTIVFAIKMFGYGARNIYDFIKYPDEIFIPIDSRLESLFKKYNQNHTNIKVFYSDLSKNLNIPILHLDGIVWNLYNELIK